MASMLNTVADYLVQQSIQVSVVFGLVLATTWGLRKASAHWRYLLWLLVIAKCLTPPLLSLPLPVFPQAEFKEIGPSVISASVTTRGANFESEMAGAFQAIESSTGRRQASDVTASRERAIRPKGENISKSSDLHHINVCAWLVMAWIFVVGVLLACTLAKAWANHRRLKRTRSPVDDETRIAVDALAESLGMRTSPAVYTAASVTQPFVWGWLRGAIYLPPQFADTGAIAQREAILTHELAHVARWDAAANLVQHIVQAIFFFHPLIWWANKKIRQEREKCCDEIVLSGLGTRPQLYCEAIVEMLTRECQASHSTPTLAVTGSMKSIEDRFTTILTPNRKFRRRPSGVAVATFLFMASCVLPTAFVLTTRADSPNAADKMGKPDAADKKSGANKNGANMWRTGQVMDFRVINAETKEPIPGVNLELQNMGKGIDFQDVKVQTTDAAGRSLIQLPDLPPSAVRVYPSKPGFVPLRVYWAADPAPVMPKSITIPMQLGKKFGGVIRNELGEPIAGVAVAVHYWGAGKGKNPHVRANICADNFTCKGQTTSDEKGRWHIDVMPAEIDGGRLKVYLHHPDYVSDHLSRARLPIPVTERPPIKKLFDQTAVMIMRKGETIEGRIIDEKGRPIAKAAINDGEYYWNRAKKPAATTDRDGKFRLSGLKPEALSPAEDDAIPGRFRAHADPLILTIQAAGYAPELVEVRRSSLPLEIRLKRGGTVHGRVVDENGKPIQGASISAYRWREHRNRLQLHARSDGDGNFRLTDAPTDEVKYFISKKGYMLVERFPMSPSPDEYLVTMKPPLQIIGSVVDAESGEPLDKFLLIRGTDYNDGRAPGWMRYDTKTIINGRYETTFRQEGFLWRLRVEADGFMPAVSRIFRPYNPDKGEVRYDFKLRKADPLTGTVLGLNGHPLAHADVYLATERINIDIRKALRSNYKHTKTNMAGRFELPAEVEPFCLVVVHKDGIGMTTEEDFEMHPRISIQPWTDKNQRMQIIRKPAPGQHVDFPTNNR